MGKVENRMRKNKIPFHWLGLDRYRVESKHKEFGFGMALCVNGEGNYSIIHENELGAWKYREPNIPGKIILLLNF